MDALLKQDVEELESLIFDDHRVADGMEILAAGRAVTTCGCVAARRTSTPSWPVCVGTTGIATIWSQLARSTHSSTPYSIGPEIAQAR